MNSADTEGVPTSLPLAVTASEISETLLIAALFFRAFAETGFKMSLIGPLATPFGLGNLTPGYRQLYRHRPKIAWVALDCRGSVILSQHRQGYLFFFNLFAVSLLFLLLFLPCAIYFLSLPLSIPHYCIINPYLIHSPNGCMHLKPR